MAAPNISENIASSNEFTKILDITENADVILNEAEAWAEGTKGGVPVMADDFSYSVIGGLFTCSIDQNVFREAVGRAPGYTRYFMFTYNTFGESTELQWILTYSNNDPQVVDLADFGITINGSPLQSNSIRVIVTDSDIQYHNNAYYYATLALDAQESINNLDVTATKVGYDQPASVSKETIDDHLRFSFSIPQGDPGPAGVNSASATASSIAAGAQPSVTVAYNSSSRALSFAFGIPSAEGTGVALVDGVGPTGTSRNVELGAVRYSTAQSLPTSAQQIACNNIGALIKPSSATNGQCIRYIVPSSGSPEWVAASINEVPNTGTTDYILRKTPTGYAWTEENIATAISSSDIDIIMDS